MFLTVPTIDQTDRRSHDQTLNTDHIVSIAHRRENIVLIVMSNGDQHMVPLAPINEVTGKKFDKLMAVLNRTTDKKLVFPVHTEMV